MRGFRRLNLMLFVVCLGMIAPIGVASSTLAAQSAQSGTVSYPRGDAGRTGAMPGPGPAGKPVVEWQLTVPTYATTSLVADGVAYISTGAGTLFAIDIATGEKLRDYTLDDANLTALALVDNVLYVGLVGATRQSSGSYVALRAATGKELWRFSPDGPLNSPALVVSGGHAYVVGDDLASDDFASETLYAIDATTGSDVQWEFTPGGGISSLAVSDSMVYFGSEGVLYGLHAATGRELMHYDGPVEVASPVVEGTVVTFVDRTESVWYGVDALTGDELWSFAPHPYLSVSALVDGVAYVNGDNVLYALDALTGDELWSFQAGDDFGAPSVVGDTVYVGSWRMGKGGWLFAINAATGEERWHISGRGNFAIAQPVVVDGLVLITTGTGEVYAIGGSDG